MSSRLSLGLALDLPAGYWRSPTSWRHGLRWVSFAGFGTACIAAVSAGAWGLGYFYSTVRPDVRIAALGFGAAYLIPFTFAAGS